MHRSAFDREQICTPAASFWHDASTVTLAPDMFTALAISRLVSYMYDEYCLFAVRLTAW